MYHANTLCFHYYSWKLISDLINSSGKAVLLSAMTYYVCTEWTEGMSPTHVEMSRVEPLEEADVIKTLCLEEEEKQKNNYNK